MRRGVLLLAAAAVIATAVAARAGDGMRLPQHAALMAAGERALQAGDTAAAIDAFERAASAHDEEAEQGLVRARLQAGDYRVALALAAHVAGEHHEPAPAALYAALLEAGGQPEQAQRVRAAASAAGAPAPRPVAWGAAVPAAARVLGHAVLVDKSRALMPTVHPLPARLWVRNGLGQAVAATPLGEAPAGHEGVAGQEGLVMLALAAPLPWDARLAPAPREPFAGSPAYVVAHGASAEGAAPAWPRLQAGFFGARHTLAFALAASAAGAPLLDASGRLAGIAMPSAEGGAARWQPLRFTSAAADPAPARILPDEAYERGLRVALQVIGTD
jgi:hypothetical protein